MTYVAGPYSAQHAYLQWGGNLPGGELFSCGMRFVSTLPGTPDLPAIPQGVVDNIGAIVAQFHQTPTAHINPACVLTYAKLNVIGTDGKYKFPNTYEWNPIGVPGGGNADTLHPNQVALAISLVTAKNRGPAHRGRFYLPSPAIPVFSDGRLVNNYAGEVAVAAHNMIQTLNNNIENYVIAVGSRKAGSPAFNAVTGVEVGRVFYTQRRRRNGLAEAYVAG